MNVVLWIVSGVVAVAFLMAGGLKLAKPLEALKAQGMGWVDDFGPAQVKGIGALEVLGAVGVILPGVLGVATVLVPLAATGLALVMVGALITHVRRHEPPALVPPLVLLALAAFVAWGRFGPYGL